MLVDTAAPGGGFERCRSRFDQHNKRRSYMTKTRTVTLANIGAWVKACVECEREHAKDIDLTGRGVLQRIADELPSLKDSASHCALIAAWQRTRQLKRSRRPSLG